MDNLKLYEISEKYIAFLRHADNNVFSAKEKERNHTRKYLGIVYTINNYNYYIPLSSPKSTDYQISNGERKIRKNKNKIIQNAKVLYKQKKENIHSIGYLKSTVDFLLLEKKHDEFIANHLK